MAIQTKAQLLASSNTAFPDNTSGDITPAILRGFNTASIDSYAALSGSNTFVGDQVITGSLNITGSVTATVKGATKYYEATYTTLAGVLSGTPTVKGPNGENLATLQSLGWNFTGGAFTVTVNRPTGSITGSVNNASRPLVDIQTHGRNDDNVFTKSPTGINTATYTAAQTFNTTASIYTVLTIYGITSGNAGYAAAGTGSLTVTFGEIQN